MIDYLGDHRRTHYCGQLREGDINKDVCVMGWVQRQRDLGNLIFIDLRDRTGTVQLTFDDTSPRDVFDKAFHARGEHVLSIKGKVKERASKNKNVPTGDIEIAVSELKVLAKSETPPFDITDNTKANEELRLKYRYLDLRRPVLQTNMLFRHKAAKVTRDYFYENGFLEIETPMLIKSTPEGARDYLVPSRIHKGSFYALPQSPQIYKQLSMVAGFDRYIQLARCFRDEDLRADRQPEFTQIDMEMSFVDVEDILAMTEGYIQRLFSEMLDIEIPVPIPRYSYKEVIERYGSDKPDLRFGMEISDLSEAVQGCEFVVFSDALSKGGSVRGITIKGKGAQVTRKEIDKLTEYARGCGAKGLAWVRHTEQVSSSFGKFLTEQEMERLLAAADCNPGDLLLIIADQNNSNVLSQLGQLRVEAANRLGIERAGYNFLWVVDMPYFEWDEEGGQWVAMHHPFTSPTEDSIDILESDKGRVKAKAYDLVLNGVELCSGSIRITNPQLQSRVFSALGLTPEEADLKFGFLLDAFKYGAPPHGGLALGLDRLVMQMLKADSLREVVAFPKVQNASELMTDCPAEVPLSLLEELGITLVDKE